MGRMRGKLAVLLCALLAFNASSIAYGGSYRMERVSGVSGRPVIRLASDSDASEGSYEEDEESAEEWQEATASDAVRKPEFYWSEDFDGVTVTLSAKEGVFPEGAWAEVEELDAAGVATDSDASGTGFVFDIALYDEDGGRLDDHWPGRGRMDVEFSGDRIEAAKEESKEARIIRVDEDGAPDVVKNIPMNRSNLNKDGISFQASRSTVYGAVFMSSVLTEDWGSWDEDTKTLTITSLSADKPYQTYLNKAEKIIVDAGGQELTSDCLPSGTSAAGLEIISCGDIAANAISYRYFGKLESIKITSCGDIGEKAFYNLKSLTSLEIESCGNMGKSAFNLCSNLETIGIGACGDLGETVFNGCNAVTEMTIGTCGNLGKNSIYGMSALETLKIGSCKDIANSAFGSVSKLETIEIGDCGTIGEGSRIGLSLGGLKTLKIDSCTAISKQAFWSAASNLETIEIGTCGDIAESAFQGLSKVASLKIKSCGNIGGKAFYQVGKNASTLSMEIGACQEIGEQAFMEAGQNASETVIRIAACGSIGKQAFKSCASLKEMTLNCSGDLGTGIFNGCTDMEELTIKACGNTAQGAFLGMTGLKTVTIESCGDIGSSAFSTMASTPGAESCSALETVTIRNCGSIGGYAFRTLSNLKSVTIDSCTSVGGYAFHAAGSADGIEELVLKDCRIAENAFYSANIKTVVLEGEKMEIEKNAFASATIRHLTLTDIGALGEAAFVGLKQLETLTVTNLDVIDNSTFKAYNPDDNHVKTMNLTDIRYIGAYAFENFQQLETVNISGDCEYIGAHAFSGCDSLKTINIADSTRLAYSDSFVRQPAIRDRVEAILAGQFDLIEINTPMDPILPDKWTSYKVGVSNSVSKPGDTQLTKEARWSDGEKTQAEVQIKAYYTAKPQMDFIIVADCSNSMSGIATDDAMNSNFYNMQSKMMDVAEEILESSEDMDARIAFATFGETDHSRSRFYGKGETEAVRDYIWNDIVNYYSNTNYSVGLADALELVRENAGRNMTVIFISDGQPYYDGTTVPEEYYGAAEAGAIRAEGVQVISVLQQVAESELPVSEANMERIADKVFASTDLEGFSQAINDAIDYAQTNYTLTDTIDPAFTLDETSVEASSGTFEIGEDAAGRTTITWKLMGEPFEEHTLTFRLDLRPLADHTYPVGTFDTNEGDAPLNDGTTDVNRVPTLQLPREETRGDLTVTKTVTGNKGSQTKDFDFYVELDDQSISGTYGDLEFKDGAASFQLRHGGSVTAKGLPGGTGFMVREGNNYAYTVTANGVSGSEYSGEIAAGDEVRVAFVNHRSGSSGGGGGDSGGGGTRPGGKPSPGGPGAEVPAAVQDTESGSPHPEINRLPVMGIEGPGFETETAPVLAETVSGAQAAQAVIPELQAQYAQNTDLAAWLTVPGTGFGYPVMCTPGNWEYYLHHNFAGQADKVGIPFFGEGSEIGGDNTLIHGHNVNGTLQFGYIWNYQYPDFRAKHPTIDYRTIYDANGTYEVMSIFFAPVYPAEAEGVFKWYQYVGKLNEQQFNYYVENVKASSLYDTGVTASYGDRLITLETCADDETNTRLVVVARRKAQ